MFANISMIDSIDFMAIPISLNFDITILLLYVIFAAIFGCVIHIICTKKILHTIISLSIFSTLVALYHLLLDAPDVAMTEVALGSCLSTAVFLNVLKICGNNTYTSPSVTKRVFALILCLALTITLTIALFDFPEFASPDNPIHTHLTSYYINNTANQIGIPSLVAAILASYRAFDTLGEATVILLAGFSCLYILGDTKIAKQEKISKD